ncbi:sigma-70 region 4 domain-containing protein [Nonomuraea fuscirosea]|uniref:sigma-70 region 4 domain-containing protein n=1 Tax=Nonomuraea fuscirosea TaxID=1291556 RepID=UPI0033FA8C38
MRVRRQPAVAMPSPRIGPERRRAILFCFLDDHSPTVMAVRFGFAEDVVRLPTALRPARACCPYVSHASWDFSHELTCWPPIEPLSPLERAVYVLREAFSYSHAVIAELLGISESANQRHRCGTTPRSGSPPSHGQDSSPHPPNDGSPALHHTLVNALPPSLPWSATRSPAP